MGNSSLPGSSRLDGAGKKKSQLPHPLPNLLHSRWELSVLSQYCPVCPGFGHTAAVWVLEEPHSEHANSWTTTEASKSRNSGDESGNWHFSKLVLLRRLLLIPHGEDSLELGQGARSEAWQKATRSFSLLVWHTTGDPPCLVNSDRCRAAGSHCSACAKALNKDIMSELRKSECH